MDENTDNKLLQIKTIEGMEDSLTIVQQSHKSSAWIIDKKITCYIVPNEF